MNKIIREFKEYKKYLEKVELEIEKDEIELNTLLLDMISFDTYHRNTHLKSLIEFFDEDLKESFDELILTKDLEDSMWVNNEKVAKAYMEQLNSKSDELIEALRIESIEKIKFSDFESPRAYNFSTDSALVTLTVNEFFMEEMRKVMYDNEEKVTEFLKSKYSSRDGFISHTSNNIEDVLKGIEEDEERDMAAAINAVYNVVGDKELVRDIYDDAREYLIGNSSYFDYLSEEDVKRYNEIEEKESELKKLIEEEVKRLYKDNTKEEALNIIMDKFDDEELIEDNEEAVRGIINLTYEEIDSKTGKLF